MSVRGIPCDPAPSELMNTDHAGTRFSDVLSHASGAAVVAHVLFGAVAALDQLGSGLAGHLVVVRPDVTVVRPPHFSSDTCRQPIGQSIVVQHKDSLSSTDQSRNEAQRLSQLL
jgi:hypothetical protein